MSLDTEHGAWNMEGSLQYQAASKHCKLVLFTFTSRDFAYLQTGIGRVFFGVLNLECLYCFGYWSHILYFWVVK